MNLDGLQPQFRQGIEELIKRASGIPGFRITETLRTIERQRQLVAEGKSKTLDSKHLTGEAVDFYVTNYDMNLIKQVYEIVKTIPYLVQPAFDYGWGWDFVHIQFDINKGVPMKTIEDLEKDLELTDKLWKEEKEKNRVLQNTVDDLKREKQNAEIEHNRIVLEKDNIIRELQNKPSLDMTIGELFELIKNIKIERK
jgi:peptidoglycan L-alanyl-D-glutamate endopeptidase CwlK